MDHEQAERLISERLDGERVSPRAAEGLERHLRSCRDCRAFERAAWRLREAARFEVAPAIPDLVDPIMSAVEAESARPRRRLQLVREGAEPRRAPRPVLRRGSLSSRLVPVTAALVVGALVGSLAVGGPWRDDGRPRSSALAAQDVVRGVLGAATTLDAYSARFAITEHHLSVDVPLRELVMHVWFRAPERFRLEVADRTSYPAAATPTDLRLIVNGSDWYASGPAACPSASCPQRETRIRNRVPFSSAAPAPTDLVLPLTALGDPEGVRVLGRGTVLGRSAVQVEVPFERAASLFPFLSIGGDWRPFFPRDRVRIWLDEVHWFPLRWEVFPAAGSARDAWALRFGLPEEPSRRAVFEVDALSLHVASPAPGAFRIPSAVATRDQGLRTVTLPEVREHVGFEPVAPAEPGGLPLYRVVVPSTAREPGQTLITYADGLSFLKLGETRSWSADEPFGPVGVRAEEVPLGDGVGYYEPPTAERGRRLSIHAEHAEIYLETNLSRPDLLEIAASIPIRGLSMPEEWRVRETAGALVERVSLDEARAAVGYPVQLPAALPRGYAISSGELVRVGEVTGVTMYARSESPFGPGTIRIHVEPADELPPASSSRQASVEIAGAQGRWTPERSVLEWVQDGLYRSVDAPGLELRHALELARSFGP